MELKRGDIGIAVEGATDAAQAAADIVLTAPGLSTIVTSILYAREIFQRKELRHLQDRLHPAAPFLLLLRDLGHPPKRFWVRGPPLLQAPGHCPCCDHHPERRLHHFDRLRPRQAKPHSRKVALH